MHSLSSRSNDVPAPFLYHHCFLYRETNYCRCLELYLLPQAFFLDISSKTQGEKKNKTQAQKTQNSRIFLPNTQNSGKFFRNLRRFLTKYNKFCLKSGKFVQKLKNLPKTQGKISKNLKFPANPLPYICR